MMDDMAPVRMHKRAMHVQRATNAIGSALIDLQEQNDLTDLEMLQAVNQWQANLLKYALRAERHPDDPEKGADEA